MWNFRNMSQQYVPTSYFWWIIHFLVFLVLQLFPLTWVTSGTLSIDHAFICCCYSIIQSWVQRVQWEVNCQVPLCRNKIRVFKFWITTWLKMLCSSRATNFGFACKQQYLCHIPAVICQLLVMTSFQVWGKSKNIEGLTVTLAHWPTISMAKEHPVS